MPDLDHAAAKLAAEADQKRFGRTYNLIAMLRLVCFVILAIAAAALVSQAGPLPLAVTAITGLAFFVLALWHAGVDDQRRRSRLLAAYHKRGLDRQAGNWDHGQDDGNALLPAEHPYARDLDLVGPGGLYALLNTAGSRQGRQTLADWLFEDHADTAVIQQRSQLVQALSTQHSWRADVAAAADDSHVRGEGNEVLSWLQDRPAADWRKWMPMVWVGRVLSVAALVALTVFYDSTGLLFGGLVLSVLMWPLDRMVISAGVKDPDSARRLAHAQAEALDRLSQVEGDAKRLQTMREEAANAATGLRNLASILDRHAKRANALRAMMGALVLIEWRQAAMLEDWANQDGDKLPAWLELLGEGEALSCLSTYAAEQGGCWAELVDEAGEAPLYFKADDLAHPLLPPDVRIGNDIDIKKGQVLLLTGANASGKSTYIRSITLAIVLARLGLPVQAKHCSLQPMRLATVMRVHDDLRAGRSRFQAEVERLKHMLDSMSSGQGPVCLALDEILGGTNSRERHLGTKSVLDHARGGDGVVLVSTHDLELAKLADSEPDRYILAHFADRAALGETEAERGDMVFDYQLRPGVLQSTNALRVMKHYGLPVDLDA